MSGTFQVRVEGVQFAAAHCATIGEKCEPLHGHSYEVAAEVDGTLSDDSWVVDFVELKSILRKLCHELDHRFMLQTESRIIEVEEREGAWEMRTRTGAVYIFPSSDVAALPIDNTTAERLAQWLSGRLWQTLSKKDVNNIQAVSVEVWEGPGQRAAHRRERLPQG